MGRLPANSAADIDRAMWQILSEGNVSANSLRSALGNTGSLSTLQVAMKDWFSDHREFFERRGDSAVAPAGLDEIRRAADQVLKATRTAVHAHLEQVGAGLQAREDYLLQRERVLDEREAGHHELVSTLRSQAASADAARDAAERERALAAAAAEATRATLLTTEERLTESQAATRDVAAELAATRNSEGAAKEALAALETTADNLRTELRAALERVSDQKAQHAEVVQLMRTQHAEAMAEVKRDSAANLESARLTWQLERAQIQTVIEDAAAATRDTVSRYEQRLQSVDQALAAAREEAAGARGELAAANARNAELEAQRKDLVAMRDRLIEQAAKDRRQIADLIEDAKTNQPKAPRSKA